MKALTLIRISQFHADITKHLVLGCSFDAIQNAIKASIIRENPGSKDPCWTEQRLKWNQRLTNPGLIEKYWNGYSKRRSLLVDSPYVSRPYRLAIADSGTKQRHLLLVGMVLSTAGVLLGRRLK